MEPLAQLVQRFVHLAASAFNIAADFLARDILDTFVSYLVLFWIHSLSFFKLSTVFSGTSDSFFTAAIPFEIKIAPTIATMTPRMRGDAQSDCFSVKPASWRPIPMATVAACRMKMSPTKATSAPAMA